MAESEPGGRVPRRSAGKKSIAEELSRGQRQAHSSRRANLGIAGAAVLRHAAKLWEIIRLNAIRVFACIP